MAQLDEKVVDLSFRMFDSINSGVYELANTLHQMIQWTSSVDSNARILEEYLEAGGEVDATFCDPKQLDYVEKELRAEGVPYIPGVIPCRTDSGEKEFYGVLATRDIDRAHMREIVARVREHIERGGVRPRSMIEHLSDRKVRSFASVGIPEAMLFEKFSREKRINIAIEEPSKHERKVLFTSQDRPIMMRMAKDVANALSGPAGKALREQLLYDHQSFQRISEAVCNYDRKDGPFYVAGTKGYNLYVDGQKVDLLDNRTKEVVRSVSRYDGHFKERVVLAMDGMEHPVRMSKEQFRKLQETPDRNSYISALREIDRKCGRPEFTKEEIQDFAQRKQTQTQLIREAEEKRNALYEQKLSLDNPEQSVYQYSYLNDEMSIPAFSELENINRAAHHDKIEGRESAEPEFTDDAAARFHGYNEMEELLDEKQREQQEAVLNGIPVEELEEDRDYRIEEQEVAR